MPDITIGRLRGGYCVYWKEGERRRRYQLKARTRAEAESEGRDRYLRETTPTGGVTIQQIWDGYIDHLGDKPTAKTMKWTNVLLPWLILGQAGCLTVELENSRRLMERNDFPAAVRAAPEWTRDALRTINELEERIEAQ